MAPYMIEGDPCERVRDTYYEVQPENTLAQVYGPPHPQPVISRLGLLL